MVAAAGLVISPPTAVGGSELLPRPSIAEAEEQDGVEDTSQGHGEHHGLTDGLDVAASVLNALRNGLETSQEEGSGRQDGQDAAEHVAVGGFHIAQVRIAVQQGVAGVIDGLPVGSIALDEGCDGAQDAGAHQHEAEDLLQHSGGGQAAHVQSEQQQRANNTNDDGGQVHRRTSHRIERVASLQAGDQVTQNVGDLNGFPRNDGDEPAEGCPSGDDGHVAVKGTEGECHAAAGHGEGGNQFAVAQGDGDHHNQCHDVADAGGDGAAAVRHPAVDGDGPADSDDRAET